MSIFQYDIEFIAGTKNKQVDFLLIKVYFVNFLTYVEFVNLINSVEDINLDISNLMLATQKNTILSKNLLNLCFQTLMKL